LTTSPRIHVARFAELTPAVLHGILKLRQEVFVIEQGCLYRDIDGRDAETDARHLWVEHESNVVSALRLLRDSDGANRIGRVATDPGYRGQGLAGKLVEHALALAGPPFVLSAQAHLQRWYERYGFSVCGDTWVEDGITHVPMRRERR
jgi:ElaA protein